MTAPSLVRTAGADTGPVDEPTRAPRSTARDAEALVAAGVLPAGRRAEAAAVGRRYAIAATPAVLDLIDPDDRDDPIARQFVPDGAELVSGPEERADPIGDGAHAAVKGIVHRYPDRVLLKPMHACPVYCRFCFRREAVGPGKAALNAAELDAALGYIADRPEIFEVVITGGDPLMLAPRRLAAIVRRLDALPHVGSIRLHSRVPVVDPARVGEDLAAALGAAEDTAVWLAVHTNHPRELTAAARGALKRLRAAGIALLSQTVLLNGVNADADVLAVLYRTLVRLGVKPYYLHHPDLAPGTARFRLGLGAGMAIVRALRGRLSGLAQPTYVLDIPGGFGKVPVTADWVRGDDAAGWTVRDPWGGAHRYPPVTAPAGASPDSGG